MDATPTVFVQPVTILLLLPHKEQFRSAGSQTAALMMLVPQDATTNTCFLLATTSSPESPQMLIALSKGDLSAEDGEEGRG